MNLDDKEQWTQIEAKQTKKVLFFGKDGYSFKTSNGVEVKVGDVDDIETVQVYENKQTGKVVVVNAKGAMIDSSADNADISIYNSEVEKIKTKSGVDYVSLNNSKLMSGALDKEDLAIENGDYLKGIDISKMPKVQSDEKLTLQSGEEIAVSDYIELITKQEVGFDTEKEYKKDCQETNTCHSKHIRHRVPIDSYQHLHNNLFYNGILECFLGGFCKRFVANDCKARIIRKRVLRGSITSSI